MKKILIIGLLACYTHISSAQGTKEIVSSNIDTTTVDNKTSSVEDRLNKQDQEIQALKKDNETLKKQMKQLNPTNAKRRIVVSRVGSKQIVTE